jgi:hypothetical protein
MNNPQFQRLPRSVSMYSRAGWYQGSVFFLIAGRFLDETSSLVLIIPALKNYRWAQSPGLLADPLDKTIAALTTAICLGSAVWYGKEGDRTTCGLLAIVGGLQAWAALSAQK